MSTDEVRDLLSDEVRDLLAAIRDAADPAGLDYEGLVHRLISIHIRMDTILAGDRSDAVHPDEPAVTPGLLAGATAMLRKLGGAS